MLKVQIKNKQNEVTHQGKFDTQAEADAWVVQCEAVSAWGKPERWAADAPMSPLSEEEKAKALETRTVEVMGETLVEYKFAAEYTIEIQDITAEVRAEKAAIGAKKIAKEKRKTDRKAIDWSKTMTVKQLQDVVKALVEDVEG